MEESDRIHTCLVCVVLDIEMLLLVVEPWYAVLLETISIT